MNMYRTLVVGLVLLVTATVASAAEYKVTVKHQEFSSADGNPIRNPEGLVIANGFQEADGRRCSLHASHQHHTSITPASYRSGPRRTMCKSTAQPHGSGRFYLNCAPGVLPKPLKRRTTMSTKLDNPIIKPVFARLTPSMTREQIKRNLIAALEKSGFTVHPAEKHDDKGGSS